MKIKSKDIIIFITLFILIFFINYFLVSLTTDEIQGYGYSLNIANGMIPYKDFGMVTLPFYALFHSIILLINNSFLFFYLICTLYSTTIFYLFYKKVGLIKTLFLILLFVLFEGYFYNTFIMILMLGIILLLVSNNKYKDLLIGLLIGSIMMIKVSIGACLFLVFFFTSKNKLRAFLYSAIIPFIILIYLLCTNSLIDCINYCILGAKNFKNNIAIDPLFLIRFIIAISYIIYKLIKTKDKNYYYLLAFGIICYPIVDFGHVFIYLLIIFSYLMLTLKEKNNIILLKILIVVILISNYNFDFSFKHLNNYFIGYKNFSSNYQADKYKRYVLNNKDKRMFIMVGWSYLIKIETGLPIDKYDIIYRGNMGKDDLLYLSEIDEICNKEDCRILVEFPEYDKSYSQFLPEYKDYILSNYELCYSDFVYCKNKDDEKNYFCPLESGGTYEKE